MHALRSMLCEAQQMHAMHGVAAACLELQCASTVQRRAGRRRREVFAAAEAKLAACHISVHCVKLLSAHRTKGAVKEDLKDAGGKSVDVQHVHKP